MARLVLVTLTLYALATFVVSTYWSPKPPNKVFKAPFLTSSLAAVPPGGKPCDKLQRSRESHPAETVCLFQMERA
ncbi:hypothetical protein F5Y16DRAFT_379115 [Xylariaceae sp. FL0255]|nr:hypothetical protein F5Y16DRAFT_379115 [Xylariaceae sp. FL0255]